MKTEMLADFQICISVPLTETLFFSLEEGISQVVKVGLSLPKTITSFESPLKMIDNAFSFILKTFFVLNIFEFLSWFFGHVEKTAWLDR